MWLRDVTRGRSFGKSARLAGEIDLSSRILFPETGEHVRPIRTVRLRPRRDVARDGDARAIKGRVRARRISISPRGARRPILKP